MRWIAIVLSVVTGGLGFSVKVRGPHYASEGSSVLLTCEHSVRQDLLHKVDWLKGGIKFFQYIEGRKPPFRNFTINGATIDWEGSSEKYVLLKNLGMAASGFYSCEVSTTTPIYTKGSDYHELVVIQSQIEEPRISFGKPVYTVGDWVRANCTSGRATPTPHVTWLVNGKQVLETFIIHTTFKAEPGIVKIHQTGRKIGRAELQLQLLPEHLPGVQLTCLATIPAYPTEKYADSRAYTISVDVVPMGRPRADIQKSSASMQGGILSLCTVLFPFFNH